MRRRFALTIGLLIAAAACGGSDQNTVGSTAAPVAEAPTTEASATEAAETSPAATEPQATEPESTSPPATEPATTEAPSTSSAPARAISPATVDALVALATPINLSHAGGDQAAPHSTMFAFREGVLAGADALEMDVQLTADGVLIVQHDDTVDKTTNATGPVAGFTLEEIQALDNAHWFSPECWPCQDRPVQEYIYRGIRTGDIEPPEGYSRDDFRVVTFREVAEAFPNLVLDVEIKGSFPDAVPAAEQLAAEIAELGLVDRTIVVSFDDDVIDVFHEISPDVAVSPGLTRLTEWFLNDAEIESYFEVFQVPPFQGDIQVVDAETVQRVHDEGRELWVWPDDASRQENAEFYGLLIDYGVDGIITGRPAAMVEALSN
ncbi:MAG: glycerophosphodiester phosphodiesterase family protein [Acidimicrobiales bacterium]|uniref:glycerophosphodiester phosphodiesterase family protein n=1 Tax=uncultured Ilumatobacter sp. TaxID=879968 RepID=UPI00374F4481|tara:strand:+ start:4689 stop:5822 length:1134 start_codon:yes stop_codon:yes gene_type:complete